ncbi:hypothetical protein CAPTEDRAFT_220181, partial [Capitella teleta]
MAAPMTRASSAVSPPMLNIDQRRLLLDTGGNISVSCVGEAPLFWTYPTYPLEIQNPAISSRLNLTTELVTESDRTIYKSQLDISPLVWSDTGHFICHYANASQDDLSRALLEVFVYDETHLFAPHAQDTRPFIFMPVHQGTPVTIPCKVTTPQANVSFLDSNWNKLSLGDDLSYDPIEGFTIWYPGDVFEGTFYCNAEYLDVHAQIMVQLKFMPQTQLHKPDFIASQSKALLGDRVQFTCSISVALGTRCLIEFTFPVDEHSNRIQINPTTQKTIDSNGYEYLKIERSMVVKDVEMADRGIYRCTVKTHDSETFKEESFDVYEQSFAYLTPVFSNVDVSLGSDSADLSVSIYAYPQPNVTWFKDDVPLDPTNRRFDVRLKTDRCRLRIHKPQLADAGSYRMRAVTRDMTAEETFSFQVNLDKLGLVNMMRLSFVDMPSVVLDSAEATYYMTESYVSFVCKFDGIPTPAVFWNWQPCDHAGCEPSSSLWKRVQMSKNIPEVVMGEDSSTLTVLSRESGFYQCEAGNKEGKDRKDLAFFVTDVDGGFGLLDDKGKPASRLFPVVGDDLVITCRSNRLRFTHPTFFFMDGALKQMHIGDEDRIDIVNNQTEYSKIVTLTLSSVSLLDTRVFICEAQDLEGSLFRREVQLYPKDVKEPQFTKSLGGDSGKVLYIEPGVRHVLECDATGLPTPEIRWFHNGNEVVITDNVEFNHNFTRLTLSEAATENGGDYVCEATNRGGVIYSNMTLYVQAGGPTGSPTTGALSKGHVAMIVCLVFGGIIILVVLVLIYLRKVVRPK